MRLLKQAHTYSKGGCPARQLQQLLCVLSVVQHQQQHLELPRALLAASLYPGSSSNSNSRKSSLLCHLNSKLGVTTLATEHR
jgi:hypothetical protein